MVNWIPSRARDKLFLLALVASSLLLDPICAAQLLSNETDDFDTITLKSRSRSSGGGGGSPLMVSLILLFVLGAVIGCVIKRTCCRPKEEEEDQGNLVSNQGSTESFRSDNSCLPDDKDDDFRRAD